MDLGLKNKTAVVLAASRGLGKAAAKALAAEGCRIAICARNESTLKQTAAQIRQESKVEVFYQALDVRQQQTLASFIDRVAQKFSGVDILITNAGGPPVKSFDETNDEEWHFWFDVTFMAVARSIRSVLPYMKEKGWGRIINITSISVKSPIENLIYSNALRLAVIGLSKTISQEVGPLGITVNNVAPGHHLTDGLERIIKKKVENGMSRDRVLEHWISKVPLRRLGQPEDLASLIAFLASEKASYLTGLTVQVEGGLFAGVM